MSTKHIILYIIFCLFSAAGKAYQLTCDSIFPEIKIKGGPSASQAVLNGIDKYKKIMGLTELQHAPKNMDEIKLRFKSLSPDQKALILEIIGQYYNEVKLLKYDKGPFKTFKRHLDLLTSLILNPEDYFRQEIVQNGNTLLDSLSSFYKKTQELTKIPVLLNGEDVLITALRLQEIFFKPNSKQKNPLVIYGSFINGKAYTEISDLDFAVIDGESEVQMRETNVTDLLKEFPFSEAQAHVISSREIHGLGSINPLVLIIYENYIVLRVYHKTTSQHSNTRNIKFDEYYF